MIQIPKNKSGYNSLFRLINSLVRISPPLIWSFVFIWFLSGSMLWLAEKLSSKTLHEIAVLGATITPILFIYEGVLRKHLQNEMRKEIKNVIDEAGIQKDILAIIRKTMPASYMNLIESGVSDAFLNLDPSHIVEKIRKSKGTIKINKIWMPFVNQGFGMDVIIKSIEAGSNYKIVLCDYEVNEVLEGRAKAVGGSDGDYDYDVQSYKNHIIENISFFQKIWVRLKKRGIENNIELRLHNDFIATSLIGFDDHFLLGLYLNGKLATNGMQFKIDKDIPQGTAFYNELSRHFDIQWENAYKEIQFSETGYAVKQRLENINISR